MVCSQVHWSGVKGARGTVTDAITGIGVVPCVSSLVDINCCFEVEVALELSDNRNGTKGRPNTKKNSCQTWPCHSVCILLHAARF